MVTMSYRQFFTDEVSLSVLFAIVVSANSEKRETHSEEIKNLHVPKLL